MYTRSYYPEGGRMNLPENYDGTAFTDSEAPCEVEERNEEFNAESTHSASAPVRIPILSSLFGDGGIRMPRLGTEEILILATAAFLFFSQDGDKESALILLLLLFIS